MFDKVFNRQNSGSYKWDTTVPDGLIERGAYPLSVADMELKNPPEILINLIKIIVRILNCFGGFYDWDDY